MDQVGKRDLKELNLKLDKIGVQLPKKANISFEDNFYFIDKKLSYFRFRDYILPCLKTIYSNSVISIKMKKVTCDMGAVKFVVKGADLMRPGIVKFDEEIKSDDPVIIVDESHSKPIAVGISLFSGEDYKNKENGKAVKNLHYVGDSIWKEDVMH